MNPTNNVLVAVAGDETTAHAMETAIRRAEAGGGRLVAVHMMPTSAYESRQDGVRALGAIRRDSATFTLDQAQERARFVADGVAREAIGSRDVPFVALGAVGELAPVLLAAAAAYDCGTVVLTKQRSWWRRIIDLTARRLAREFDGDIVSVAQQPVEHREPRQRPAPRT